MKKFIIAVIIAAVVGAGILGWWFMFHRLDALFEEELQKAASEAFGTPVTISDVRVDLLNGAVRIDDLAIGNPPGFSREHALVFGSIEAAMDLETRQVARVVMDGAQIFIEEKGGETNVQKLRESLASRVGEEIDSGGGSDEELVIQRFLMRSTIATFESESLQRLAEVEVDQIEMRDVSGTPEEVAKIIAVGVMNEITEEAAEAMLRAQAKKQIDDLSEKAGEKLREILGGREEEGDGN
ncbi:MAG: hypothetical protein R3212_14495 [Xanthomonadales bacterium]|nr:hypothetical protein [Xanthomonadales bacterium]